jgi:hypothetical protein
LTLALPLAVACCSAPQGDAPTATLERVDGGRVDRLTIESDRMVDGRRARLILLCEGGKPVTFELDLVSPPASPPPPRDVFAQMQVKGGPLVTIELAWLGGAKWRARIPRADQPYSDTDDRNNQQRFLPVLHAFTRERRLLMRPPATYAPVGELVWSPQTLGPHLARAQECALLEKIPDPGV